MLRAIALASLPILLAACQAVETVPPAAPDDEYIFACDGASAGWADCEELARKACPNGYRTLDDEQNTGRTELRIRCTPD
ncbi:hypothetical protein DN820_21280 [Stutzerimonas nosocomialis]|uniref:Lipoprotein n=1 Tax=Stutzerimonas nosocomialis TaxID=1056496 RepID=A0A5R9Q8T7_9GAMM|nr:hypothetical protein [Stutzerimonas nosocomialis]TLX61440.1 hypothetical protein DN820_21280 [Stutzerimonas nosocomialis]